MNIIEKSEKYLMNTYKRFPVVFERGEGVFLYDSSNTPYLDMLAGIAVNVLGHSSPVVVDAIKRQAEKLIHVSNLYHIEQQSELAFYLAEHSVADRAFFCNSGAEANETAIKLARLYGKGRRFKIVTLENSFHGRTIATLSATGQPKYQKGFEPMLEGFEYASPDDAEDVKRKIDENTCAVMIELIQGEGGIKTFDEGFVKEIFNYCKERDVLFIVDEIQTGMGRTGRLFAYEWYGIEPDVITLAKGLGNGLPIGVTLAKEPVASLFKPGSHGSTFGGNPLVSAVSIAVLKTIVETGIIAHVERLGDYFKGNLEKLKEEKSEIRKVDGKGFMLGIELSSGEAAQALIKRAFDNKILIGRAGESTVRFEPPLIIEKEHIDRVLNFLEDSIK